MSSPGPLSLAPAIVAIGLSLITKDVVVSLGAGVLIAGFIATSSLGGGLLHAIDGTIVNALTDADHAKTLLFTLIIGGMVGVIGTSGATASLVEALARRAKTPRQVQVLSWFAGMLVFFDDYANCMIVGSAMGPLYDRHKIPREKLAYIVDSTAAPVASLALVSTWVGFEVGVVQEGLKVAGQDYEPYSFFIQSWPFRFYPILAMLLVGMVTYSGRDLGPMAKLTYRPPVKGGADAEESATQARPPWWMALVPILTLLGVTLAEIVRTGSAKAPPDPALFQILDGADGYGAIVHGSFAGLAVAFILVLSTRTMFLSATTHAMVGGMKVMVEALIVLVLAWSLSAAMKELQAPQYLVSLIGDAIPTWSLPTLIFIVGAAVSFAVGSSYTTMGIMMPIAIPLAFEMVRSSSGGEPPVLALAAAGSVLAGACFGDHCSPISDTTVLSSIGSGSDHLSHVRTQIPYAVLVGVVSVVFGTVPAGLGLNPWLGLLVGLVSLGLVLRLRGETSSYGQSPKSVS
ncbi:MAG: Na+/H+ antiporter NhaC family protein [Myxococcota bacterium]